MAQITPPQDKIGQKFGLLTPVESFYRKNKTGKNKLCYKCICDCGKEHIVLNNNLRKPGFGVQSCGCNRSWGNRAKDITLQKFGMLTAIKATEKRLRKSIVWLFKCDCGVEKEISAGEVVSGKTISCGCRKKNPDRKDYLWRNAYRESLRRSPEYGGDTDIDFEYYKWIASQKCFYCEAAPKNKEEDTKVSDAMINYQGLDRINSDVHYLKSNVLPCCSTCNSAKGDKTYFEWVNWLMNTYKTFIESGKYMELFEKSKEEYETRFFFPSSYPPTKNLRQLIEAGSLN